MENSYLSLLHSSPPSSNSKTCSDSNVLCYHNAIFQFDYKVRPEWKKHLAIWTSCREQSSFLWSVRGINLSWRTHWSTLKYWVLKNECNEERKGCSKRRVGALLGEWVLYSMWCWQCCLKPVVQPVCVFAVFVHYVFIFFLHKKDLVSSGLLFFFNYLSCWHVDLLLNVIKYTNFSS